LERGGGGTAEPGIMGLGRGGEGKAGGRDV